MKKSSAKILMLSGILLALFALGRGFLYFPNDERKDSGLYLGSTTGAGVVTGTNDSPGGSTTAGTADLPSRLLIPKLEIDAKVQHLGVTKSGNMAAPANFTDVGWYKYGTIPGRLGSAVISGHEDNAVSLDGVFKHLEDLVVGDDIYVVDKNGQKLHFRVVEKKICPYDLKGPELERIFNAKGKVRLNLITCAGDWLASAKTNDQRLVIFTELVK